MQTRPFLILSALVGVLCGILSTYPVALGPTPSLLFWTIAGVLLGLFADTKKTMLLSGVLYGFFLGVTFLYSRFGGTADRLAGYTIFVLPMSVVGAAAGVVTVSIGTQVRRLQKR